MNIDFYVETENEIEKYMKEYERRWWNFYFNYIPCSSYPSERRGR